MLKLRIAQEPTVNDLDNFQMWFKLYDYFYIDILICGSLKHASFIPAHFLQGIFISLVKVVILIYIRETTAKKKIEMAIEILKLLVLEYIL